MLHSYQQYGRWSSDIDEENCPSELIIFEPCNEIPIPNVHQSRFVGCKFRLGFSSMANPQMANPHIANPQMANSHIANPRMTKAQHSQSQLLLTWMFSPRLDSFWVPT